MADPFLSRKIESNPRMKLLMHTFQTVLGDMGIDLSSANACVDQEFLDDPEIGPVLQQVGRKTVT